MTRDDDIRDCKPPVLDMSRDREPVLRPERPVGVEQRTIRYIDFREGEPLRQELAELRQFGQAIRVLAPTELFERIEQMTALLTATSLAPSMVHYISRGQSDHFASLGPEDKAGLLCVAEKRLAAFEGREACRIGIFVGSLPGAAFLPRDRAILFNRDSMLGPRTIVELVMQCFFHESTHRLQHDAVKNPKAFPYLSEELIGAWMDNMRPQCYLKPGVLASEWFAYENQPMERYAFRRAEELMERVYELVGVQDA